MLFFAAALVLAAPVPSHPHSGLTVGQRNGPPMIVLAEPKGHDGVAAELQSLLCRNGSYKRLQCIENDAHVLCAVQLEALDNLVSVDHSYTDAGSWAVTFKGPAAAELHAVLKTLGEQNTPEAYVNSPSMRLFCETEEMACSIQNY